MIREIFMPLAVGLALFLFGMQVMRIGLTNLAAERLQQWLVRFTKTPAHGLITGTLVTAIVQSSSAVTVLTISLVNARILTFTQSVGIILGTNIGTSFTTELIALHVNKLAVPMLIVGVFGWLTPFRKIRCIGLALAGFGCIFLGMNTMQVIAYPLKERGFFEALFSYSQNGLFIGVMIGLVLTAIIQSSGATTALVMSLTSAGTFSLGVGIAIVLGANIGTCITAWLASVGGIVEAKRVAWTHIMLNFFGVLLFFPLIQPLAEVVRWSTSSSSLQIAHAQSIFNILSSIIALPFAAWLARLAVWLVPAPTRN